MSASDTETLTTEPKHRSEVIDIFYANPEKTYHIWNYKDRLFATVARRMALEIGDWLDINFDKAEAFNGWPIAEVVQYFEEGEIKYKRK